MLTFGRKDANELFQRIKQKAQEFQNSPLDTELANHLAIDAWSLCDWVFSDYKGQIKANTLKEFQADMINQCSALALFQDIANSSKHHTITRYQPRLKEAKQHQGIFDRSIFDADIFDVPALMLIPVNGKDLWFDDALAAVIAHWENFFNTQNI